MRHATKLNRLPYDIAAGAEGPFPQRMTQDDCARTSRLVLNDVEPASDRRTDADDIEVPTRHRHADDVLGLTAVRKIPTTDTTAGGHILE